MTDSKELDRELLDLRSQLATVQREEREQRLLAHFREAPLAVIVWDERFRVKEWNRAAEGIFGYSSEEAVGRSGPELIVPESLRENVLNSYETMLAGSGGSNRINENVTRDGRRVICEWFNTRMVGVDGVAYGVVSIAQDITERRRLEEKLLNNNDVLERRVRERTAELTLANDRLKVEILERKKAEEAFSRSERLASIGTLAAGIAHEINNPLGTILLSATYAMRTPGDREVVEESLRDISGDVKRCANIVSSILKFSKDERSEKWMTDYNSLIRQAVDLTRDKAISSGIKVEVELADDIPMLLLNPTEVTQVFVNLIHNAIHASSEGGTVMLRSDCLDGRVFAVVEDSGQGMTLEQKDHAFDPFFTTRLEQGGTGLGLSTSHGIVADHGGTIEIQSELAEGATFIVELPVPSQAVSAVRDRCEGTETVLVVDNEETVRQVISDTLTKRGYTVLTATGGSEAIEMFERYQAPVDLLVTDVEMPGMNGRDLAEYLTKRQTGMEVLFVSGFTGSILDPHSTFLAKPFTSQILVDKVRQILDSR